MGGPSRNKLERFARKAGTRAPDQVVQVFCEGKLEKDVLEALRQERGLSSLEVHVVAVGKDPSAIVRQAKQEKAKREAKAKQAKAKHDDETWGVFDRDEHAHFREAITTAKREKFRVATSVPCIELWAVLLYEDRRAHVERGSLQRDLKRLHRGYDHERCPTLDFQRVKGLLDGAKERAEALLAEAIKTTSASRSTTTSATPRRASTSSSPASRRCRRDARSKR